ncbi:hypothetical protein ACWGJ9_08140 [Curtobacterium citreum]
MTELRTVTIVGGIIAAASGVAAVAAVVMVFAGGFDGGANIGAGLVLMLSVPLAVASGATLTVAGLLRLAGRRQPRTTGA